MTIDPTAALDLADYRRKVASLYEEARHGGPGLAAHLRWVDARDVLFRSHPQSAIPADKRASFAGLPYFPYDPSFRFVTELQGLAGDPTEISHSGAGSTRFRPIGKVSLAPLGSNEDFTVYWLDGYGGGLFLPFRDDTAGTTTYGGGRYLLDTVKGADLGREGRSGLILDFNYAYHPSCVHSTEWSCPLAPPQNQTSMSIIAGERLAEV